MNLPIKIERPESYRRSLFAREISSIYLPISSNCLFK